MKPRILSISLLAIALLAFAACSGDSATATPAVLYTVEPSSDPTPTPQPTIVVAEDGAIQFVVHMSYNGSPQVGTATFTQLGTTIDVRVRLSPSIAVQTMVLRHGDCDNPTGYVRDLDPLIGGVSNQEIRNMSMADLTSGDMVLVVSRRTASFAEVASCGEFPVIES